MREELDHTRRWLINASGAAILSSAIPIDASHAQTAVTTPRSAERATSDLPEGSATDRTCISPHTAALADYVAGTLDRELPAAAAARTKLHILDTIAAMVSGSRLKPGTFAARYVDSIGGKPQAMVIGTSLLTSAVNAALANAMAAHADETDDTNPVGPLHAGCGTLAAALATAELAADLGTRFDVFNTTIKKWSVGSPLQSVLDSVTVLLDDPAVRNGNITRIAVEIPTESLRIVDNSAIPDLCLQDMVALMIAD